jgi:hypothetical protein
LKNYLLHVGLKLKVPFLYGANMKWIITVIDCGARGGNSIVHENCLFISRQIPEMAQRHAIFNQIIFHQTYDDDDDGAMSFTG